MELLITSSYLQEDAGGCIAEVPLSMYKCLPVILSVLGVDLVCV